MSDPNSTRVDHDQALSSFRRLIAPRSLDEFVEQYWTKAPLHVSRRAASWFDDILSVDDLERFLRNEYLPADLFRVMKDGDVGNAASRTDRGRHTNILDNLELVARLNGGHTVEIDGTQRVLPNVTRFVDTLVNETTMAPLVKIFITPASTTGLTVHYDIPEVFTLQIAGTKHWKLYKQKHRFVSTVQYRLMLEECGTPGEPIAEFTLEPGDMLYIPGGMPHCASAQTVASISLGIGLTPFRWFDLFDEMKERAMSEEAFREHLPTVLSGDPGQHHAVERFRELVSSFVESLDVSDLVRDRMERFTRARASAPSADILRRMLVAGTPERHEDVKDAVACA